MDNSLSIENGKLKIENDNLSTANSQLPKGDAMSLPKGDALSLPKGDALSLPKGWKIKKLGDVCEVIAGQSPESKFYNDKGEGLQI